MLQSQRMALIFLCKAYRTVSTDALPVLAGVWPIDLELQRRASNYFYSRGMTWDDFGAGDRKRTERLFEFETIQDTLLTERQKRWEDTMNGRHLYNFFPSIRDRLEADWLDIDHQVSQFLTGHGNFKAKLSSMKLVDSPHCECSETDQTAHHILWECPLWDDERKLMLSELELADEFGASNYRDLIASRQAVHVDQEQTQKLDWVPIYFSKQAKDKYRCNICQLSIEIKNENKKNENLLDHVEQKHKEVFELHKDNPDETVGFRIEFLHLNVLNEDGNKTPVEVEVTDEPAEKKQIESTQEDRNIQYVLIDKLSKPANDPKADRVCFGSDSRKRSWVWKYFEKISSVIYRCNLCNVVLSIKGSNTNNMNRHVKSKHPGIYRTEMNQPTFTRRKTSQDPLTDVGSEVEVPIAKGDEEAHATSPPKSKALKLIRRSWIWTYFTRLSAVLAECKLCNRKINHGGNATGNMNRHLKFLHKDVYFNSVMELDKNEEVSWIWKLFSIDEENFYSCKICNFRCLKFSDLDKSVQFILDHLKTEHGVISGDQIISGPEESVEMDDECTVAVDFLKGTEM